MTYKPPFSDLNTNIHTALKFTTCLSIQYNDIANHMHVSKSIPPFNV